MLRTKNLLTTAVLLGGLGLTLLAAPAARAGLIPNKVSVSTIPDANGNYTWTYNVVVTSDVYVQPGDYFTIYDFANGTIGTTGASAPTDWVLTSELIGRTPDKTGPLDDPGINNYTWTYAGTTAIFGQQTLGNYTLISPFNRFTDSDFTSSVYRQDNDHSEHTITSTTVPVASAGANTPEPATLVLAAAGLPIVGLIRRRRR